MKTKIFAKTLNPEYFDYSIYDIREDEGNLVFIDGGRHWSDVDNNKYLASIKKFIKDYDSWDYEYYYRNSIKDFLKDMLPAKENGNKLSPKEIHEIREVLANETSSRNYEIAIICTCLSIITGRHYKHTGLQGSCQGEYVDCYYPEGSESCISWVEAWYWGTGTEIMVHEEEDEVQNPEDIEGWTFYTASWKKEDLVKEIKEQCGYKGDDKDIEVVLWEFTGYRTIKIDEYKLAE